MSARQLFSPAELNNIKSQISALPDNEKRVVFEKLSYHLEVDSATCKKTGSKCHSFCHFGHY